MFLLVFLVKLRLLYCHPSIASMYCNVELDTKRASHSSYDSAYLPHVKFSAFVYFIGMRLLFGQSLKLIAAKLLHF